MNAALDGTMGGNGGNQTTTAPTQQPQNNSQGTPTAPVAPKASWFSTLLGNKPAAPVAQQPTTSTQPTTPTEPTEAQFFAELFTPKATTEATGEKKETPKTPWDVDGDKLSSAFGNLDITNFIKPEQVTAALGGDATAFMEVLNLATRIGSMAAYKQAMQDAQAGVTHTADGLRQSIPQQFKELSVDNNIRQNPAFSAPELQPLVKAFKDNMLSKYPNATEADINTGLSKYLTHLGGLNNPSNQQNTSPTQQSSNKIDWDSEFKSLM